MRIVWDEVKRRENLRKHNLDFAALTEEWFAAAHIEPAKLDRWMAIGELDGVLVVVVIFVPLGSEATSVISMRPANRAERIRR